MTGVGTTPKRAQWHKKAASSLSLPTQSKRQKASARETDTNRSFVADNHRFKGVTGLDLCHHLFPLCAKTSAGVQRSTNYGTWLLITAHHFCMFLEFFFFLVQKSRKSGSKWLHCIQILGAGFRCAERMSYQIKIVLFFILFNGIKIKS